ncbi:hypothetical protein H9P43_005841 [Blastocladiella emersonii ATCC 22665]|nr:hypothetical protein H9P43_005841 [Blastocladiella emersonii ATCC 22665]
MLSATIDLNAPSLRDDGPRVDEPLRTVTSAMHRQLQSNKAAYAAFTQAMNLLQSEYIVSRSAIPRAMLNRMLCTPTSEWPDECLALAEDFGDRRDVFTVWMLEHCRALFEKMIVTITNQDNPAIPACASSLHLRLNYRAEVAQHAVFLSAGATAALTWGGWDRVRTVFDIKKLSAVLRPLLTHQMISFLVRHKGRYVSAVYVPSRRVIVWTDPLWKKGNMHAFATEHNNITSVLSGVLKRRVTITKKIERMDAAGGDEVADSLILAQFAAEQRVAAELRASGDADAAELAGSALAMVRPPPPAPELPGVPAELAQYLLPKPDKECIRYPTRWFTRRVTYLRYFIDAVHDLAVAKKSMPSDPVVAAIRSSAREGNRSVAMYFEEEPEA